MYLKKRTFQHHIPLYGMGLLKVGCAHFGGALVVVCCCGLRRRRRRRERREMNIEKIITGRWEICVNEAGTFKD